MSIGAAYILISSEAIQTILKNDTSLSDYVFNNNNQKEEKVVFATIEQAWDAFNHLLSDHIPNILGSNVLEDVDLGEQCMLFSGSELIETQQALNNLTELQLNALLRSDKYQTEEFYWNNVFCEESGFDEIKQYISNVKALFNRAVSENKVILFYIS